MPDSVESAAFPVVSEGNHGMSKLELGSFLIAGNMASLFCDYSRDKDGLLDVKVDPGRVANEAIAIAKEIFNQIEKSNDQPET